MEDTICRILNSEYIPFYKIEITPLWILHIQVEIVDHYWTVLFNFIDKASVVMVIQIVYCKTEKKDNNHPLPNLFHHRNIIIQIHMLQYINHQPINHNMAIFIIYLDQVFCHQVELLLFYQQTGNQVLLVSMCLLLSVKIN